MERIFIFGCSFTQYIWPTWADILEHEFENVYNYGLSGIGNVGISHKILEADLRHNFTSNDSIYILWTTWHREDRMINGEWKRFGNVYNNPFYKKDFYKYCCDSDHFIKNSSAIIGTNKTYKDLIKFQGHIKLFDTIIPDDIKNNYVELYNLYYKEIPNKHLFFDPINRYNSFDEHPTVLSHIEFLKNTLNISVSKKTQKYFQKIHNNLINLIPLYNQKTYQEIHKLWRPQKTLGFR